MNTVTLSPKRKLEALLGRPSERRLNAGTWMGIELGDTVREKNGRHLGRVEFIAWSSTVRVRWFDTGWITELRLDEVERVR